MMWFGARPACVCMSKCVENATFIANILDRCKNFLKRIRDVAFTLQGNLLRNKSHLIRHGFYQRKIR